MGRIIGRIHAVGGLSSFETHPSLDQDTFGKEPRNWLLSSNWIPIEIREIWKKYVDRAFICVEKAFESCGYLKKIRLHGDCHSGNILWTDEGLHFVDFDDALKGPAIQDIWMLLSGNKENMQQQLKAILEGYELFCEWNPIEIRLIEPLRTLRLIHYSAWIARRWKDPAFPPIFTWFGTTEYWKERIIEIQEQLQTDGRTKVLPNLTYFWIFQIWQKFLNMLKAKGNISSYSKSKNICSSRRTEKKIAKNTI